MRIFALFLLTACAVESNVTSTGKGEEEWTCEDLIENSTLDDGEYLLVPNVDPQGWVALVQETRGGVPRWVNTTNVSAEIGVGLVLRQTCDTGTNVRLSWW